MDAARRPAIASAVMLRRLASAWAGPLLPAGAVGREAVRGAVVYQRVKKSAPCGRGRRCRVRMGCVEGRSERPLFCRVVERPGLTRADGAGLVELEARRSSRVRGPAFRVRQHGAEAA